MRPTEAQIRLMVDTFYERVREDPELAPIFEHRIGSGWDKHLDRMVDFWSGILLATGRFNGNPREKHRAMPELRSAHFDRWLELFREVVAEVFEPPLAEDIHGRASRMRVVLDAGFASPGAG